MKEKADLGFAPSGKQLHIDPQYDISSLDPRLSRTNYFDGRLLKASDLTRDQTYLDERLREVGRISGSGIVSGFDVVRDPENDRLSVWPGLAVAPSGRVLELEGEQPLSINPYDAANIASLNPDTSSQLQRGLYVLAVQFAEIGTDSAEVYPRDLEGQRGFRFNAWSEGVEITLVPLRHHLPNSAATDKEQVHGGLALAARAALVREFISNPGQPLDLSEDAVALALLAIEHGRILWLDEGLVRRQHRHPHTQNVLQQDLHRHYQELLNDIIQSRIARFGNAEFPASHHFRVLPPYGELPKSTVNPAEGRQSWFPAGYEVSIAPVRTDDLGAILAESAALDPIDLEKDDDVDIMILVPMSDHQFAWRARQLQHREASLIGEPHTALPHLDRLALRLYDVADESIDPDDASIWNAIWAEPGQPLYVRRPPRVAETLVSGVVLASGYEIPKGLKKLPPNPEEAERQRDLYNEKLKLSEREVERLKLQIKELEATLELDADERLKEAEEAIFRLREQLEAALVDKDELELLRKQHDHQKAEIEKLLDRIAALEGDGSDSDSEHLKRIEELRALLAEAEDQVAELKKQLERVGSGSGLPTVTQLVKLRGGDERMQKAAAALAEIIGDDSTRLLAVQQIAQLVDRRYDPLLMDTLVEVAKAGGLGKLRDMLSEILASETSKVSIGVGMAEALPALGMPASLSSTWVDFQKSLEEGDGDIGILRTELEKAKGRIAELEASATTTTRADEVTRLEKDNAELRTKLDAAEARSVELEASLASASRTADTSALEAEITRLRTELDSSRTRTGTDFSIDFRTVKSRPLEELWEERLPGIKAHPDIDEIKVAAEKVFSLTRTNTLRRARACQILAITPSVYDAATWRTLPVVLVRNDGTDFRDYMVDVRKAGVDIGLAVAASTTLGLSNTVKAHWVEIDMPK